MITNMVVALQQAPCALSPQLLVCRSQPAKLGSIRVQLSTIKTRTYRHWFCNTVRAARSIAVPSLLSFVLVGCMSTPFGLSAKTTNTVILRDNPTDGLLVEVKNSQGPGAVEGALQSVELIQTTKTGESYTLKVGVDRQTNTVAQAEAIAQTHAATLQTMGNAISQALSLVPSTIGALKPPPPTPPTVTLPVLTPVNP